MVYVYYSSPTHSNHFRFTSLFNNNILISYSYYNYELIIIFFSVIKKQNTLVCQFASPLDVDTHVKPEVILLFYHIIICKITLK